MRYLYPAIFKTLENGDYFISAPDLPGCLTEGKNLLNALDIAKDAISVALRRLEIITSLFSPRQTLRI